MVTLDKFYIVNHSLRGRSAMLGFGNKKKEEKLMLQVIAYMTKVGVNEEYAKDTVVSYPKWDALFSAVGRQFTPTTAGLMLRTVAVHQWAVSDEEDKMTWVECVSSASDLLARINQKGGAFTMGVLLGREAIQNNQNLNTAQTEADFRAYLIEHGNTPMAEELRNQSK